MRDNKYTIDATGDVVRGDRIKFVYRDWQRVQLNRYGKLGWKLGEPRWLEAEVLKESYGAGKQQHTFTLRMPDGKKRLMKGRVLYREQVLREPWADESARDLVADEKHERGDMARERRQLRREEEAPWERWA